MTPLIEDFKDCAHQAGETCRFTPGKLIREFGLKDFLENNLSDDDDASTIAVKALHFFCKGASKQQDVFMFAVLTVSIFLNDATPRQKVRKQAMIDLVAILGQGINENQIRTWINSNF